MHCGSTALRQVSAATGPLKRRYSDVPSAAPDSLVARFDRRQWRGEILAAAPGTFISIGANDDPQIGKLT